jgi:hypothetical protein
VLRVGVLEDVFGRRWCLLVGPGMFVGDFAASSGLSTSLYCPIFALKGDALYAQSAWIFVQPYLTQCQIFPLIESAADAAYGTRFCYKANRAFGVD